MNMATAFGESRRDDRAGPADGGAVTLAIGGDERRMHVRAYNHWVSLLKGRAYPSIEDLDPAGIADFGPNSVLLDFSRGIDDPTFPYLGRALREECGIDMAITRVAEVPARSLLSRLTDHYLQIIANRAPIGFEAEFIGRRGTSTLYRGILMPFSSDDDQIDFIYGVINWKEVADAATQVALATELREAARTAPVAVPPADPVAIWADGPRAQADAPAAAPEALADHLAAARDGAATLRAADGRSRAALYDALSRAHDFALAAADDPDGFAELLEDAGLVRQARAPMTPVVKLVFGHDHDKTRLTEFATVLTHAARVGIRPGELGEYLGGHAGGIKAIVAEERARKRRAERAVPVPSAPRPVLATVTLDTGVAIGGMVVLLARGGADGAVEIVGAVADPRVIAATERALG